MGVGHRQIAISATRAAEFHRPLIHWQGQIGAADDDCGVIRRRIGGQVPSQPDIRRNRRERGHIGARRLD